MTGPGWDDDRLLAELAAALAPPDVPPAVLQSARTAFTWRTLDAELAALTSDSAGARELAGSVRGDADGPRTLVFTAAQLAVEVELDGGGLVGQLVPPRAGVVEVLTADGPSVSVPVDSTGSFEVRPAPSVPFRLSCSAPGEPTVVTAWVS